MSLTITQASLDALQAHARQTYPEECCGMIIERDGREAVVRIANIQNKRHEEDPVQFPRTAATAYAMGPESAPVLIGADRGDLRLLAFYHSHPDHDAYFSAEDRTQAMGGWDEPNYPDARQIVVSVRERVVKATKAFAWDAGSRDFLEIPLGVK
jgi:proteasome lid subunit RPN8/RPN11